MEASFQFHPWGKRPSYRLDRRLGESQSRSGRRDRELNPSRPARCLVSTLIELSRLPSFVCTVQYIIHNSMYLLLFMSVTIPLLGGFTVPNGRYTLLIASFAETCQVVPVTGPVNRQYQYYDAGLP